MYVEQCVCVCMFECDVSGGIKVEADGDFGKHEVGSAFCWCHFSVKFALEFNLLFLFFLLQVSFTFNRTDVLVICEYERVLLLMGGGGAIFWSLPMSSGMSLWVKSVQFFKKKIGIPDLDDVTPT